MRKENGPTSALDDPRARVYLTSLRRKTRLAATVALPFAALATGLYTHAHSQAATLQRTGTHTTATVIAVTKGVKSGPHTTVRYTANGTPRTAILNTRRYRDGQQIRLTYNPAHPDRVRTDNDPNIAANNRNLTFLTAVVAIAAAVITLILLRVNQHTRRLLRTGTWQTATPETGTDRRHRGAVHLLTADGARLTLRQPAVNQVALPASTTTVDLLTGPPGSHYVLLKDTSSDRLTRLRITA